MKLGRIVQRVEEELVEYARVHEQTDSMKWAAGIVEIVSQDIQEKFNQVMDWNIETDESMKGLISPQSDERMAQFIGAMRSAKKTLEMVISNKMVTK